MDYDLPDYATVTPDELAAACTAAMGRCDAALAAVAAVPAAERDLANTLLALEAAEEEIVAAASGWAFLAHTAPDDALREAARTWEERLGKYQVGLDFHEERHRAVTEFAATDAAAELTGEEARLLEHTLRDQRRSGMHLPAGDRARLRELFDELVELETRFQEALGDWDDGIEVTAADLEGLPASFADGLERTGDGHYRVTLDYPQYVPFMAGARSSRLRRELMHRNQRKGGPENVTRLERALAVRAEIAALLGHASWAEYRTQTRMAARPEAVSGFLDGLRARVAVKAAADLEEYARAMGTDAVEPWDHAFALEQLKRTVYAVDDAAVAEYFPLDACVDGMFGVMRDVLGVEFQELHDVPVWHPDVRVFDVCDSRGADAGVPFARFYADLFPRPNKYKHAAVFGLQRRRVLPDGTVRRPAAAIVANFTKPQAGRPSLLRHSELTTLFHEFGHVLHATLTRARRAAFSGTATERDFVEAPSQMLEHWCWEPEVLGRFARHHESGQPLPKEVLDGMIAAKRAGSGVQTMRQIFFATLDLRYHSAGFGGDSTAVLREEHARHALTYQEDTYFQAGFGHLFGYDAGYYGYLWSRAIGDDMYTRFEAAGPTDPATGADYRRLILEPGGSRDGADLARGFLGREPDNTAFLRDLGLESSG